MKKRRIYLNLAVFGLAFVGMIFWAINQIVSVDAVDKPYRLAAEFPNAVGVLPNAEVTYLGVPAGLVTSVKRDPAGKAVRISMKMQQDRKIPDGSTANIFRKSAIGEQYVDFEPPAGYSGTAGPFYKPGTLIPLERTTIPLEFSELLRSASAVIGSIDPNDVSTLLHEAALGLNGRTDSLRLLTESGDKLSSTLAAKTEALDRLATNSTRLTQIVADHRNSFGQPITDLHQLAESLRNAKGDTSVLLDRGSLLLRQLADLVAAQKGNLDCDLKILEQVTDATTTDQKIKELAALLDIGPRGFNGVWDSRDVETAGPFPGPWIRVGLITNGNNPAPQYVPPKEVPAGVKVPACSSPLRPVTVQGADYVPPSGGGGTPFLPWLPQRVAVLGLLALLLGATAAVAVRSADLGLRSAP